MTHELREDPTVLATSERSKLILQASAASSTSDERRNPCNPILGRSAEEIERIYSNGNRDHFHCSFEPGPTSKASAVEIEVKNGNYLEFDRGSGFKERELATGDSRV